MCYRSKNLYNYANYILRQEFINNGNYIDYKDLNKELKTHQPYKDCMSQPANCVLRVLDKNWKSYFAAIKDWKKNPDKYLGMPKLPGYLPKDGRFNWIIPNNTVHYVTENNEIYFQVRKLQNYKWFSRCIGRLIQVRFVPKHGNYIMEIVYEEIIDSLIDVNERCVAVDLGVNNLLAVVNNIGTQPFIINGKPLKSINRLYNKKIAENKHYIQINNNLSWSKKMDAIAFKRLNRINNYFHNTSKILIEWCIKNNIDTIIIGLNKKWKQKTNMGKINNQNFIDIPYELLIEKIRYKAQNNGIKVVEIDEAYTSRTSFIDNEMPIERLYDKSRRVKRGMFISNQGILINADINAAYQILRKVFPKYEYGIGVFLTPYIVNLNI